MGTEVTVAKSLSGVVGRTQKKLRMLLFSGF